MKFVSEYRTQDEVKKISSALTKITTKKWNLMEICGGQTHSILKFGIDKLLPENIQLIHGPGCPVCVTPTELIDKAIEIASQKNVIFTSFGDMLRVPGTKSSLAMARSKGADVRFVYSPMDSLKIAKENPEKEIVFFAIGFETTTPANAFAIFEAKNQNIKNFSCLVSQMLVPPALKAILSSPTCTVDGFLAAGHVCTVMGYKEYEPLAIEYKIPIVVTGFEPLDLIQGIYLSIKQLQEKRYTVENQYARSVKREGNTKAQEIINEVFDVIPRHWRGIGEIPASGLGIKQKYSDYDAETRFGKTKYEHKVLNECISGLILTGEKKPTDCPCFSKNCTPEHPLGATMVSNEGTCAAYYKYKLEEQKI